MLSSKTAADLEAVQIDVGGAAGPAKHLFVLCHGLWGFKSHMEYMARTIREQRPEVVTLLPDNFPLLRTYDGAHVCAMRTLRQLRDFLKSPEGRGTTHLSLVGYSFGGLVCRYLAGILFLEDFLGLVPVNFLTMATPHLGVMKSGWFDSVTQAVTGESGKQMVLRDDEGVLLWSTLPDSIFARGLAAFSRRTMFGNAHGDRPVPTHTAMAIPEHRLDKKLTRLPEGDFPSADHPHVWHVLVPAAASGGGGGGGGKDGLSRAASLEALYPFSPEAPKAARQSRQAVLERLQAMDKPYDRARYLLLLLIPIMLVWVTIVPLVILVSSSALRLMHARTERRESAACPPQSPAGGPQRSQRPASYLPHDLISEEERREVERVRALGRRAMEEAMSENLERLGWYRAVCGLPTGVPTVHGHIIVRRERFKIGRDIVDFCVRALLPAAAVPRASPASASGEESPLPVQSAPSSALATPPPESPAAAAAALEAA